MSSPLYSPSLMNKKTAMKKQQSKCEDDDDDSSNNLPNDVTAAADDVLSRTPAPKELHPVVTSSGIIKKHYRHYNLAPSWRVVFSSSSIVKENGDDDDDDGESSGSMQEEDGDDVDGVHDDECSEGEASMEPPTSGSNRINDCPRIADKHGYEDEKHVTLLKMRSTVTKSLCDADDMMGASEEPECCEGEASMESPTSSSTGINDYPRISDNQGYDHENHVTLSKMESTTETNSLYHADYRMDAGEEPEPLQSRTASDFKSDVPSDPGPQHLRPSETTTTIARMGFHPTPDDIKQRPMPQQPDLMKKKEKRTASPGLRRDDSGIPEKRQRQEQLPHEVITIEGSSDEETHPEETKRKRQPMGDRSPTPHDNKCRERRGGGGAACLSNTTAVPLSDPLASNTAGDGAQNNSTVGSTLLMPPAGGQPAQNGKYFVLVLPSGQQLLVQGAQPGASNNGAKPPTMVVNTNGQDRGISNPSATSAIPLLAAGSQQQQQQQRQQVTLPMNQTLIRNQNNYFLVNPQQQQRTEQSSTNRLILLNPQGQQQVLAGSLLTGAGTGLVSLRDVNIATAAGGPTLLNNVEGSGTQQLLMFQQQLRAGASSQPAIQCVRNGQAIPLSSAAVPDNLQTQQHPLLLQQIGGALSSVGEADTPRQPRAQQQAQAGVQTERQDASSSSVGETASLQKLREQTSRQTQPSTLGGSLNTGETKSLQQLRAQQEVSQQQLVQQALLQQRQQQLGGQTLLQGGSLSTLGTSRALSGTLLGGQTQEAQLQQQQRGQLVLGGHLPLLQQQQPGSALNGALVLQQAPGVGQQIAQQQSGTVVMASGTGHHPNPYAPAGASGGNAQQFLIVGPGQAASQPRTTTNLGGRILLNAGGPTVTPTARQTRLAEGAQGGTEEGRIISLARRPGVATTVTRGAKNDAAPSIDGVNVAGSSKRKAESKSESNAKRKRKAQFFDEDVLFGCSEFASRHSGFSKYWKMIKTRVEEYRSNPSRNGKNTIILSIMNSVWLAGGRFMKCESEIENENGEWIEVSNRWELHKKIAHDLGGEFDRTEC